MRTYLTTSPWIFIHYLHSDEEMDREGFSEVDFECLICGVRERIDFDASLVPPTVEECEEKFGTKGDPEMRAKRDAFEVAHQHKDIVLRRV